MGKKGQKVYSYVIVDDNANIDQLGTLDKLRAIYAGWQRDTGRDEIRKAKNEEALIEDELTLRADLLDLLRKATQPIRDGKTKNVCINVDKPFDGVLDDILSSNEISDFYTATIINRPKPEFDAVDYFITIKLVAK